MDLASARARAQECRRIASLVAANQAAKEHWEQLAEKWEASVRRCQEERHSSRHGNAETERASWHWTDKAA